MPLRSNRFLLVNLVLLAFGVAVEAAGPRTDASGDPLPDDALARLGSARFRLGTFYGRGGALSPDGKLLAVLSGHDRIALLDTTSGKEVRHLHVNPTGIQGLTFSPDGQVLAVSDFQGLTLHDANSGAQLGNFQNRSRGGQSGTVTFSADSRRLAMGNSSFGQKTPVIVWDVRDKKEIAKLDVIHDQQAYVALSADGKLLATWGQEDFRRNRAQNRNNIVQLWDVATAKELRQIEVDNYMVAALAFAPSGKHLALVDRGTAVSIRETATGKQVRRFAARSGSGALLRYSPDGKRLMAGTFDGAIQVWDAASGKRLALCRGPKCQLTSAEFLPGGKVLAAGFADQSIMLWEAPSGQVRTPLGGHTASVGTVGFSRDGKTLISVAADGVRLWEVSTGKALRHDPHREDSDPRLAMRRLGPTSYLLSPEGHFLIASSMHGGGMRVLERASGEEVCTLDPFNNRMGNAMPAAFAADGVTFASLSTIFNNRMQETAVRVWDLTTGQEVRHLKIDPSPVQMYVLALSPDGKVVAVASNFHANGANPQGYHISLRNVASGKEISKIAHTGGWVTALTFSPDGSLLATGGQGEAVRLWDVSSGSEVRAPAGQTNLTVSSLGFAPDGRLVAAGVSEANAEGGKVLLYEVISGKVRAEFVGHRATVHALAFAPDGRTLASGSADTTVLLWDVTGQSNEAHRITGPLSEKERDILWSYLDHADAQKAHRAMARLLVAPADAVALLRQHVSADKGQPPDPKEIDRLIAELDSDDFATREKATRDLEKAGRAIRPALVKALEAKPSLEKRRRLEQIVRMVSAPGLPPELIRPLRVVEVLERLGTPEARQLLESLAGGNPSSRLTTEAKTALRRLARQP